MEQLKAFHMAVISAVLMVILGGNSAVTGQINTPCTTSMISSFTPCANLITGSTNNGAVPSSTCCESLRSLVNTSVDCACLVISASVPFQLPFSSTLALSLTRACNMNAVPAQCKASGSPLPAPGPAVIGRNGPRLGPTAAASPWSPQASEDKGEAKISRFGSRRLAQAQASLAPAPVEMEEPTTTPGIRPVFTPPSSSSNPLSLSFSPVMFSFISLSLLVATGF
ncbi:non-specific lipid transfer protein GPI-anchored 16-like [Prosopis cineraria]|uniref:non-specific lipid transfer protein GPI-anchored 16-like n=1 Tax=Prosopis cineraria TaxID=364024 RepID=UPI0024100B4D|nr:non-specific lipid transfer protein GPI-anchored 16-like [Prosopis cineraria]